MGLLTSIVVSGAGSAAADGTYASGGHHGTGPWNYFDGVDVWQIADVGANWALMKLGSPTLTYYRTATKPALPPKTGWLDSGDDGSLSGAHPAPTLSY